MAFWTPPEKNSLKNPNMYDWSFLSTYENPSFWFLDSLLPPEKKRAYTTMKPGQNFIEKRDSLIDGLWVKNHNSFANYGYESKASTRQRVQTAKKRLREIIRSEGLKDGELVYNFFFLVINGVGCDMPWGDSEAFYCERV
jgi:hypothetical protein